MSGKDKELADKLGKLPPEVRARFLDQIDGAAMAIDYLRQKTDDRPA